MTTTTADYSEIHTTCGQAHRPFTPCPLTDDQLDGFACLGCEGTTGAMQPVGIIDGCHACRRPPRTRRRSEGRSGPRSSVGLRPQGDVH